MTDQERPVEERNELLDDQLSATSVVVEEPEALQQENAAANEQPESAEQPAASAVASAPITVTDEGDSAPVAEAAQADASDAAAPADNDVAAVASVTSASETPAVEVEAVSTSEPSAPEAEAASETPAVEAEAASASEPAVPEAASETPAVEVDAASASEPAVPEAASETPAVEVDAASTGEAPVAEGASYTPVAEDASETPVAEGASYTPVAEDESGRPRRVKDLEPGMEIEGRVTSIALYGIFVDIGVGRDGLVHISEMSDTRIDSPSDVVQIGNTVKVRVKSVEPDGRRISLTMRSKERGSDRRGGRRKPDLDRERLASLRVGDNVEGTVTGIAPFGVFVDIGVGKDGLVHVSELAEGRVERAEDAVQVGQSYTFKILEVDAEGTRISLSLRRAQRTQRLQQIEKGQILDGKVSGLAAFGAFVDIGVGRDGLVHISELTEGRIEKVEDAVKVGDPVRVRVLEVDPQSKRISLTMMLEDRPREAPPSGEPGAEPRRDDRSARFQDRSARFQDRGPRDDRGPRRPREAPADAAPEVYSVSDEQEEFKGDATLEDLLSKFSGGKRERRRRPEEPEVEEESGGDRYARRQRDAIRRTLQQLGDDD